METVNFLSILLLCAMFAFGEIDRLDVLNKACVEKVKKRQQTRKLQCLTDDSSKLGPNHKPTFAERDCFCDARCFDYGDCCLDISYPTNTGWNCRKIPTQSFYIFMKQSCMKDWIDDRVRNLCEEESEYLWANNQNYHHLQDIPVYSTSKKVIYRNVFCAMCNNDNSLQSWNTKVKCDRQRNLQGGLESAVYIPNEKKWLVNTTEEVVTCWIHIEELTNFSEIVNQYNGRRCRGISSCSPTWMDEGDRMRCAQNDGLLQYTYYNKFVVYKNPSCAKCNNINTTLLMCDVLKSDPDQYFVWYPGVLDFNFDDSKDKCGKAEIYDPVLKACLTLSCGHSYEKIGDKCVIKENSTDEAKRSKYNCEKVVLGKDLFVLLEDDVIYVNHTGKLYSKDEYETEFVNGKLIKVLICSEDIINFNFSPVQYLMSEIGLMISVCCLLVHLAVYMLLPTLRNLPGKILMCLSASLLFAQASFMLGAYGQSQGLWYCRIVAVITHLTHLAAFFWMNVMALDICRTFCSSRPRSEHSHSFLKYSLYASIFPILITVAGVILDVTAFNSRFSPHYGSDKCWITQKKGVLVLFALPVAILLLANIFMFILTATSIRRTTRQTRMATKKSEKVRFLLYVKIALILGLTWVFGFVASLTKLDEFWYPFIVFNTLQGAFIFLSFTVKRKVWKLLKEQFGSRKRLKKGKAPYAKYHSSTSNLSTLQTTLTTSLSASVPVLCNQKEIVQAIVKGNFQAMKNC